MVYDPVAGLFIYTHSVPFSGSPSISVSVDGNPITSAFNTTVVGQNVITFAAANLEGLYVESTCTVMVWSASGPNGPSDLVVSGAVRTATPLASLVGVSPFGQAAIAGVALSQLANYRVDIVRNDGTAQAVVTGAYADGDQLVVDLRDTPGQSSAPGVFVPFTYGEGVRLLDVTSATPLLVSESILKHGNNSIVVANATTANNAWAFTLTLSEAIPSGVNLGEWSVAVNGVDQGLGSASTNIGIQGHSISIELPADNEGNPRAVPGDSISIAVAESSQAFGMVATHVLV